MPRKKNENISFYIGAAAIVICLVLAGFLIMKKTLYPGDGEKKPAGIHTGTEAAKGPASSRNDTVQGKVIVKPDIDYQNLKQDEKLAALMETRKKNLGIRKSLDMIVKSDESFKVGGNKVSMQDIIEKSHMQKEKVFIQKIEGSGAVTPLKIKEYGIYVVQPNDNIWNIHFNLLKEYYDHQGISVSPKADEPDKNNLSSGVGKILKFSENMVMIYNLSEKKIDTDIDLLEPLSKIVIYNMDEVFSLLKQIEYKNIDRIQFDGKTIWIPVKKL